MTGTLVPKYELEPVSLAMKQGSEINAGHAGIEVQGGPTMKNQYREVA